MSSNDSADLVFTNGAVYTVDAARRWADAVAVRGGRIVAVGTDADVRERVSSATDVVDLAGRMLVPGFQDAHVHPPSGGVEMLRCNLSAANSRDEYERIVKQYAADHPEVEWVLGGGWAMDAFPGGTPTKDVLDAIVPDRPVFLPNRDGHGAWVNSRALEIGGVTKQTPDPSDGRIERDAEGEPSGTLHEGAMDLVARHAPPESRQEWAAGLRRAQKYLHSLGITAWQDAIVGGPYDAYETYLEAAERGDLTARVVGAQWWDRHAGQEQIERFVQRRARATAGRFRATSVKIMQDGVCENYTAAVLEPYLAADGTPTDNRGISFVEPEALKGHVTRLDAEGFQVHFHALAERAVREALDAIGSAREANGPNDHRHHLAHLQIVHPDDIPRFRPLGAVANMQPLWAMYEPQMIDLTIPFLGEERCGWQYPFASLLRAGAQLCAGSDWSVSSPDPIEEIHVAVNRTQPPDYVYSGRDSKETEIFIPDERISLADALHAFTMGSAFVNHLDDVTGSIEVGKYADVAVIDRNLFAGPPGEIALGTVELTLVEGQRVYETSGFRA